MPPTPQQLANATYDALSPHQQLASILDKIAYLDTLRAEDAPTLILCARPAEQPEDILELTICGDELLAGFQQLLLGRLELMRAKAVAAVQQTPIPEGCTASEMEMGNGITVTIVRRNEAPPIARSEAEVVLD